MKRSGFKQRRTLGFMAWVTMLIIVACVSGAYSLKAVLKPIGGDRAAALNAADLRGAAKFQALQLVKP